MKRFAILSFLLLAVAVLCAQWHIDQNFDAISTIPAGWTVSDDGDGMTWRNLNNASHAHSGTRAAFADNYLPNQNADWLITPQIPVAAGDSLFFYTRSWTSTENLKVYVSTSGNNPNQLTTLIANLQGIGTTYQAVKVSLSQFVGQNIYIGFFWQCVNYGILVDDVKIGKPLVVTPELNLPESISFFQGENPVMDFAPLAVFTDIQTASLSVTPTSPINVAINGMQVSFSSPEYVGTQTLQFTLTDGTTGLTASDEIAVTVSPIPAVDLAVVEVISPRSIEYQNMPFTPQIKVSNLGLASFSDQYELNLVVTAPDGSVAANQTLFQTSTIAPGQSSYVVFNEPFTPAQTGNYTYLFSIVRTDENMGNNSLTHNGTVVLRITTGGPDAFGYRYIDSDDPLGPDFNWIDISDTGTSVVMLNVPTWAGDDNFSEPVPLGFSFPFYGSQYSSAYIDINGEILLADNSWYAQYPNNSWDNDGNMFNYMYPIPGYAQMPGFVGVYWDDLEADQGTGDVYFQSFGESPNRYAVIQWHNLRYHAGTGGSPMLRFQVILHENGEIVMQYLETATGQSGSVAPHNDGASATVAIQNAAANAGLCYLREIVQNNTYIGVEPAGNLLHDNLAIKFYSGTDTQAPIMTHKAVGNTFKQEAELNATIIDMSELVDTSLHYSTGTGWQSSSPVSISSNQYTFNLINLPWGSTVEYYLSAQDVLGNSARLPESGYYSFKILPSAGVQTLVLYSGTQDYQHTELPVYEALLGELNITYDTYNWEEFDSYRIPDQYKAVLAYSNTGGSGIKSDTLAVVLAEYLHQGSTTSPHNLWFSSDNFANNQHGHPDASPLRLLMSGYFRTSYIPMGFGGGTNGLAGPDSFTYENGTIMCLPGSPIGTPETEYQVYANTPDCVFPSDSAGEPFWDAVPYPEIGSEYIFAFEDGPVNGQAYLYHGVCATAVDTPSFKTVYFSFDLSQIVSSAARHEMMADLAEWFGISPVSSSDPSVPQLCTSIDSVYPNPFNPSTTISYSTAKNEALKISVYNLKGQRIASLFDATQLPGRYSLNWDARDDAGKPVASGIYYLKLETPSIKATRKITLIK